MASHQERNRRYTALREIMGIEGFEVLLVCGRGNFGDRGPFFYVTDLYIWGGQSFAVLPLKGEPILFQPGYSGVAWAETAGWILDNRSAVDQAQAVAQALIDLGLSRARIGVVGMQTIIAIQDQRTLETALPNAMFQDATALFDSVRIHKSVEEIGYLRETSNIMKRAYLAMEAVLVPGITEKQLIAEAQRVLCLFGCLDGFANISRSTRQPVMRPPTNDTIQKEDVITFDLEFLGPHGYGLELSGHYSFGPPPDQIQHLFNVQNETYQRCLEVMKPGISSRQIIDTIQVTYKKHGFSLPGASGYGPVQFHAHGIGLDLTEPPFVPGQDVMLTESMVIALHPHIGPEDRTIPPIEIQDNVLVTPNGGERLSYKQAEWTQL